MSGKRTMKQPGCLSLLSCLRILCVLGSLGFAVGTVDSAKASPIDEAQVEAHLQHIYRYHGKTLFRWQRPVRYIVTGLSEQEQSLIDRYFGYVRDLTGLDIERANPSKAEANFFLVFSNPIAQIAELNSLRAVFGRQNQTDDDYRRMLEGLDRDGTFQENVRRSNDSILQYGVLTNPTLWERELLDTWLLKLIVRGLTDASASGKMRPSVWSPGKDLEPMTRLPAIDEAFLKALYRGNIRTGTPVKKAIRELVSAISSDLNK